MKPYTRRLIRSIRSFQKHSGRSDFTSRCLRKIAKIRYEIWSVVTHSDIDPMTTIGEGLELPHAMGIVFHGDVVIGQNCMIMQQVTLGMIGPGEVPVIGDDVYIGAGAKVIGKVRVGNGARIGAGAVVLKDIPANYTAVGNPARNLPRSKGHNQSD